ncbi:helix-turn-helix transcriptional regulator [Nocardiopsis rhodophaea]|uniref:helix-turn-helix domain-containing protein n=1 Tax=Nocardiopsis rhodophaea TaxID=280238 RepID=UPI0031D714F3
MPDLAHPGTTTPAPPIHLDLDRFDPAALRYVRQKHRLSMADIAARTKRSMWHLYKVERGERPISRPIYDDICAALALEPGALLSSGAAE